MAGPLYPQFQYQRSGIAGRDIAQALAKRMFDRPLKSPSLMTDVRAGARGAYEAQAKPFVDFARRPGVMTGAGAAAVALPVPYMAKALKLALNPAGRKQAAAFNKQVDSRIVPFSRDIRSVLQRVLEDPSKGIRDGGFYSTPGFKGEFGSFVEDRTAIIQDPITGTMFAAPGAIHGELIKHVAQKYPQFARGNPQRWMQHEVYAPTDFGHGLDPVPARMMFALAKQGHAVDADTLSATVSRARLMQALAKMGVKQDDGIAKSLESRLAQRAREAQRSGKPARGLVPREQRYPSVDMPQGPNVNMRNLKEGEDYASKVRLRKRSK